MDSLYSGELECGKCATSEEEILCTECGMTGEEIYIARWEAKTGERHPSNWVLSSHRI